MGDVWVVDGVMPMLVLGGILFGLWGFDCWNRPYVDCVHCEGEKKDYDAQHEHFGMKFCTWCANSGMRLRWELRLLSVPF